MRRRGVQASSVVFFGELGCGNLGNDGSLAVAIEHVRALLPGCELLVLGYGPQVIRDTLGVPAESIHRSIPNKGGKLFRLFYKMVVRVFQTHRTLRQIRRSNIVIVPGAGVAEGDLGTRPFGFPYALLCLAVASRLAHTRLVFLAIGVSTVSNRLSRLFLSCALRLASYRSYRDSGSLHTVCGWGIEDGEYSVYADAVFAGVPRESPAREDTAIGDGEMTRRRTVAFGVMAYRGASPRLDLRGEVQSRYVTSAIEMVRLILEDGYGVRLLIGDLGDLPIARRIVNALGDDPRVQLPEMTTLEDVDDALRDVDLVIGTRFHNVVLAIMNNLPTVALVYGAKTAWLMDFVEIPEYSLPIADFRPEEAWKLGRLVLSEGIRPSDSRRAAASERAESQWTDLAVMLRRWSV